MTKPIQKTRGRVLQWTLAVFATCMVLAIVLLRSRQAVPIPADGPVPASVTSPPPATEQIPAVHKQFDEKSIRPLPIASTSPAHEWTTEDATDLTVIEKIARNPEEAVKMIEENDRILRRQLVYRKQTVAKLLQDSRLSGEPVSHFTLPGLDGQELEVEVISSDLAPSGQTGTFHGRLAGSPQSLVTLAFEFGIEAYTILSPEDQIYLQADPRESGELIVRSFDPDKFMPFQCGNPEHDH